MLLYMPPHSYSILHAFQLSYQILGTGTFALCGALSGAAALIITNPMDIAKLRLQVRILENVMHCRVSFSIGGFAFFLS
jgi:hypothetical protein